LDTFGIPAGVLSLLKPNPGEVDSADGSDRDDAELPTAAGSECHSIETAYLKQLKVTHRARARAAMRWRPRFLKGLAMSCSYAFSLKAARVCYNTVRAHERNDPEFAAQLREAEHEGAELLHHVCWNSAVEGNVEPVYFQGEIVGEVRKFDTRLRIEFLRAYMPDLFKTPGQHNANISTGTGGKTMVVIGAAERDELVALRREALEAIALKRLPAPAPVIEV
jgi:hypothetical protein